MTWIFRFAGVRWRDPVCIPAGLGQDAPLWRHAAIAATDWVKRGSRAMKHQRKGLNRWLFWTANASLAACVEINGIELFA